MPMSRPAYMDASIATPRLTANQHTGNGRDHLCIVEHPDVLIIFPSWCSSDHSLSHIIQHVNYTQVPNFDMALQTGYNLAGWESTFLKAGISATSAKMYAQTFSSEEITRNSLHMLDCMMLKELGIKTMGDVLAILKLTEEPSVSHMKLPTAKLPQLISEMTTQQFRKFRIDWDIFTRMTNLPTAQTNIQLYNCADEAVQNSIINTYPDKLLDMLKASVSAESVSYLSEVMDIRACVEEIGVGVDNRVLDVYEWIPGWWHVWALCRDCHFGPTLECGQVSWQHCCCTHLLLLGWHIVFAGSRFCTNAERRYAPIEGEAAAIAWALEKCRIFVMGCPQMIVVTNHQPLTGIFGDRDLSKVHNPRLFRLKEKCLWYFFSI